MRVLDCCSTLLTFLPDPSLPFLPAFLLGLLVAGLILLYLYKKETNLPLGSILLHMIRSVFVRLPSGGCSAGHSEGDGCNSPQCVRCQKYGELQAQIGARWRRWKKRVILEPSRRVEEAVRRLEGKGKVEEDKEMAGDARKEREEEEDERKWKSEEGTEGKLKYRGKVRRDEDKTCSLEDERESTPSNQRNATNTTKKRESAKKEKREKLDRERKKEKKQTKQACYQKPTLFRMDLPANPSWNDYDVHINEQKLLKLNFDLIMQEYEEVFKTFQTGDTTGWKNNIIPEGHWCIFPFVDQGTIVTSNCRRCPGVAEMILGCLPAMMNDCVFGNAAFSILYPDSHITPHHGPTNLRLRCHLGLKVPPGCWLEMAGQQYKWAVGETLLFDDSFTHSAHFMNQPSNVHSEPRAVLLLDFWHPDVSGQEKECLLELLAPLEGV